MRHMGISGRSSPNTVSISTLSIGSPSEKSIRAGKSKPKNLSRVPFGEREFMSWDGEGGEGKYWLFGCSDGDYVQAESGLTTYECFALLMRKAIQYRDRIHIAYGFNYDVTMMTVNLPDAKLQQLKDTHHTSWGRWHLEWMPNKWFRIYDWRDKVGIRIYDGMTFFQTSFVKACEMVLGVQDERLVRVRKGKAGRSSFSYVEIDDIRTYMFGELSLSDSLFSRLRELFAIAGIHPRGWYGPGAIASCLLAREGIKAHITRDLPDEVLAAAAYAYFGGRFESYYTGRYCGPVYSYDIRSAYPHALRGIPSLGKGTFRHVDYELTGGIDPRSVNDFALYRLRYDFNGPPKAGLGFPHPFPYRDKQNRVFYPPVVEGWYWGVEVKAAAELFSNAIHIYEGWVYEQEEVHESPFAFVVPLYEQRARWKVEGNGAQLAAKLALNSLYGKLAQRVGWNKETKQPPRWHQLEYAGYITATCRAMIYRAMMQAPADIIAVETDGIYSRVPLKLDEGTELGQWEAETFDEIIYVQSGVYWTVKNNTSLCGKYATVNKAKVRGFGSGSFSYRDAVAVVDYLNPLIGSTHRFGALSGFIGKPQLRQWMDNDRVAQWGGGGKRGHATKLCHKCNGNGSQLHNLVVTNFQGGASHPHFLPWRAAVGERNEYQEMADDERYAVVRL
jgi:hypothetical protein